MIKAEAIRSLEREKGMCMVAIDHLEGLCKEFEEKYHWTTDEFLQRFDSGLAGDDEVFFKWYAVAQGLADWKSTKRALEEVLVG